MPSPFIHSHLTQSSGWLPACEDWSKHEELSYGWERAIDSKGRSYYIKWVYSIYSLMYALV